MLGIGHVHLKVSNLKRAEDFYKKLGFKVRERFGNYIFMTLGKKHHDLALQEIPNAEIPDENSTGLYHFAIEIKDLRELATVYFNLRKQNINISAIDHGISKALYLSDPDGNRIEIYLDTRHLRKKWGGFSKLIKVDELKKFR